MSDSGVIERIDAFCDAVPRERARAEAIGALVLFVPDCQGVELLAEAGLEVAELPALAALAAAPNGHLSGYDPTKRA